MCRHSLDDQMNGICGCSKKELASFWFCARRLATVVFHEALHNLMDANDATLHGIGGPICRCEYEQARNDKNIEKDLIIMSNAMMQPRPQWEDGFDIVAEKLERDRQGKSSAITPFAMRPAWA
jgi:hypothetical protein